MSGQSAAGEPQLASATPLPPLRAGYALPIALALYASWVTVWAVTPLSPLILGGLAVAVVLCFSLRGGTLVAIVCACLSLGHVLLIVEVRSGVELLVHLPIHLVLGAAPFAAAGLIAFERAAGERSPPPYEVLPTLLTRLAGVLALAIAGVSWFAAFFAAAGPIGDTTSGTGDPNHFVLRALASVAAALAAFLAARIIARRPRGGAALALAGAAAVVVGLVVTPPGHRLSAVLLPLPLVACLAAAYLAVRRRRNPPVENLAPVGRRLPAGRAERLLPSAAAAYFALLAGSLEEWTRGSLTGVVVGAGAVAFTAAVLGLFWRRLGGALAGLALAVLLVGAAVSGEEWSEWWFLLPVFALPLLLALSALWRPAALDTGWAGFPWRARLPALLAAGAGLAALLPAYPALVVLDAGRWRQSDADAGAVLLLATAGLAALACAALIGSRRRLALPLAAGATAGALAAAFLLPSSTPGGPLGPLLAVALLAAAVVATLRGGSGEGEAPTLCQQRQCGRVG